jgi:Tol biopolymer transport system component
MQRKDTMTWKATLVATFAACLIATPVAAAGSKIAWTRTDQTGERAQIVSANPNGAQLQSVTSLAPDSFDIDAMFSPDGSQIVFERDHEEAEVFEVGIVDTDGENEEILDLGCTDPCFGDLMPGWLHDGSRITYTPVVGPFEGPNESAAQAVLHTAEPDGSDVERLSEPGIDGAYEDYHARYSPDGSYLVFVRIRNADLGVAIFRMDADGSDVRRLTPWRLDADLADLSLATRGATENLIVFETYGMGAPRGKNQNIATVPAGCPSPAKCAKRIRYVTEHGNGPAESFNPTWSPNGKRIAFTRFRTRRERPPVGDIYTIRPNGKRLRPVSTSRRFEFRPDWGVAP